LDDALVGHAGIHDSTFTGTGTGGRSRNRSRNRPRPLDAARARTKRAEWAGWAAGPEVPEGGAEIDSHRRATC
jgi:hypothetical protein